MAIENDFLPFAIGSSANVISQSAYVADTADLQEGFQSGIANSAKMNKVWRQSSIMASMLAQFIVNSTGQPAIDDGTTATLLANFTNAIVSMQGGFAGVVNVSSNTTIDSTYLGKIISLGLNTVATLPAASTIALGSAFTFYSLNGATIQASGTDTITAGSISNTSVPSPAGQFVRLVRVASGKWSIDGLLEASYNPLAVAPATQSNQAVNLGQFASSQSANGYTKLPNGTIIQWGGTGASVSGVLTVPFPIAFPNNLFAVTLGATTVGGANFPTIANNTISKSSFPYSVWNLSGSSVTGLGSTYIAIGN
jgi:hypothetical protein